MRITVLAVGRLKDSAERDLLARYLDRAKATGRGLGFSGFNVVDVAESRAQRPEDRKAAEAAVLREKAGEALVIVLDERGPYPTSEAFAEQLAKARDAGRRSAVLVVGGADGLDPALIVGADDRMGFGRFTLPHQLVRVLVAEQLYRAMTILAGHPYHRA
ncbi:23S rRNA (pseudouridine(1915)-N(3))-methyltransferase RlmH [Alsobacter sp. R-9]